LASSFVVGTTTLDAPAKLMLRLRREAKVTHNRDTQLHQPAHDREHRRSTF